MRFLTKSGLFLYNIYAFTLFLAIMFLIIPLVILASFLGRVRGGNLIYTLCRFWADACIFLWGIRHRNIYEAEHDGRKQYIFVSNHISYLDIPVIFKAVRRQRIRILGKAEMAKVPIFGFIYRNAVIMVDRDSAQNRHRSIIELKAFIRKGISVFICPEGTFNETGKPLKSFYDGAFRIAIETQTPVKPLLFLDTFDRMHYSRLLSLKPGRNRVVYLEEVPVEGLTTADTASLKNEVYKRMEAALIHYKASWIAVND